jgi:hypothetical protein
MKSLEPCSAVRHKKNKRDIIIAIIAGVDMVRKPAGPVHGQGKEEKSMVKRRVKEIQ